MRLLACALACAFVLSCSASDQNTPTTETQPTAAAPAPSEARFAVPIDGLPTIGDKDALVTIVEFTDYECPYCAKAEKTMHQLRESYGRDIRFAVAMHPLPMHPHARDAALVALASTHFEEAHAHLFDIGGVADPGDRRASFEALASSEQLGSKLRVTGTPTFFV